MHQTIVLSPVLSLLSRQHGPHFCRPDLVYVYGVTSLDYIFQNVAAVPWRCGHRLQRNAPRRLLLLCSLCLLLPEPLSTALHPRSCQQNQQSHYHIYIRDSLHFKQRLVSANLMQIPWFWKTDDRQCLVLILFQLRVGRMRSVRR